MPGTDRPSMEDGTPSESDPSSNGPPRPSSPSAGSGDGPEPGRTTRDRPSTPGRDARDSGGGLTLAFDLAALEALASPRAVFADARRWSRHVGVVDDDARAVESYVRRHGVRQDYELADLEPVGVLSKLKWEADTDRFVLVGADEEARALAEHVNWEYVPVEEAAAKAGWTLRRDAGLLERARAAVVRLAWPFRRSG